MIRSLLHGPQTYRGTRDFIRFGKNIVGPFQAVRPKKEEKEKEEEKKELNSEVR
jgi:hypothetical protein